MCKRVYLTAKEAEKEMQEARKADGFTGKMETGYISRMIKDAKRNSMVGDKLQLVVDPMYIHIPEWQRRLKLARAYAIGNTYNKYKWDVPKVLFLKGKLYVIDGQHRLFAARKLFGEDYLMECKVIHGLSQMEESNLFVKLNSSSKPLQYADKAKGLYYGNDETTVNIYNICKNHGVELGIEDDKRASMDGRITAVKALTDTYNKIGAKQTDRLVKLLNDTWDGKSAAFKQEMIKAVGVILSLYSKELNDTKFIKKLSKVSPTDLVRMAKSDRVTNAKIEAKIARIMVNNYYNKGKGATPLEYRFGF